MKNYKRGFAPVVFLIIIAVAAIGGGAYVYKNKNLDAPDSIYNGWKKYSDNKIEFEYPELLNIKQNDGQVVLYHSLAYKHGNVCDFKGDSKLLENFIDFSSSFQVVNKNVKDVLESSQYPGWEYASENPYKIGSLTGYKVMEGIEGCGNYVYYFNISPAKTLIVKRYIITELNEMPYSKSYLSIPGIITPAEAEDYYTKIFSTIKVK